MSIVTRSRTPEPPYCWQSKEALRRIRNYMQAHDQWPKVSSRIYFYIALSEMASNRGTESFRASQKALTDLCGLSARTQREILRDLQGVGVITALDPVDGGQGQKTYTLLSFDSEATSGRTEPISKRSVATSERSEISESSPSLPTLEITIEEQEKKHREDSSNGSKNPSSRRNPSSRIQLVDEAHIRELKMIYQPRDVDKAVADFKAWRLTPKGKGKQFTKRRLQTFLRDAEALLPTEQTSATSEQVDRNAIDPDQFHAFLIRQYPAGLKQGWTPENAPAGVVRNFLKEPQAGAV